jgi:phospho-N-acetylmuramoyl-pentapeptide-transferase
MIHALRYPVWTVLLSVVVGALPAFALSAALGWPLLRYLRSVSYRQQAYEDAPESHQKKTGTPTMGGLLFLVSPILTVIWLHASWGEDAWAWAYFVLVVGSAAIGFADDYSAIRRGRNRGLGARAKFLATAVVGALFLFMILQIRGPLVWKFGVPLLFIGNAPVWLWFALSLAVILATTHAVNLTDGLDGLAAGTVVPPLVVVALLASRGFFNAPAWVAATTMIGAALGFLIYNRHPAKLFMGDTGSLALGAALAGVAILTGAQLLLLLVGGVFVVEALSVIIQVTSFKTTGRRVFRMSPLHHHFELAGWPETKVTASFWLTSLGLGIIGLVIVVRA